MYNIEPSIITSIIGGLGVFITLMVLATGYRSNYSYQYQQKQQSPRERYITMMNDSSLPDEWVDPDFMDDEDIVEMLQILGC